MPHPTRARLFVAVDPPAAVCEALSAWAREALTGAGDVRRRGRPATQRQGGPVTQRERGPAAQGEWRRRAPARGGQGARVLAPESLHLTLAFLGSRPVEELEVIDAALGSCPAEAGELSVGAPALLPPRQPRALAIEVRDRGGELGRLQQAVCDAMSQRIDWTPERRRFRAHITVMRMSAAAASMSAAAAEHGLPPTPQLTFTPSALVLYRSHLSPAGASYEPLMTRELEPVGA